MQALGSLHTEGKATLFFAAVTTMSLSNRTEKPDKHKPRVKITTDSSRSLSVIEIEGAVSPDDLINALKRFYEGEYTLNLMWDYTRAELTGFNKDELERIIEVAKQYAPLRERGKTALVTTRAVDYGFFRMYELLAEFEGHPLAHSVFNEIKKALDWLDSEE